MPWRPLILLLALAAAANPAQAAQGGLQAAAERALGSRAGAIVALNAQDGRIAALVHPRVAAGAAFPVGSLAKVTTAMAALDARATDGARRLPCHGAFERWTCWKNHGPQTLEAALADSCSSYFFVVGRETGAARLNRAFVANGFGSPTGSDVPGEAAGVFLPARTRAELTELAYGDTPRLQATPLQVAVWMGAIANGGMRYAPHLHPRASRVTGKLAGSDGIPTIHTGLRRAVLLGSASGADVPGEAIHGKTGTATHADAPQRRHGWFAGFAGERVVVVFLRDGNGYADAAPLARAVFAAWR